MLSLFVFSKSEVISPLDDLAFDMYQDPEVAQIIRKLDEEKHEAVKLERYDFAKKLKQAIADLQKVRCNIQILCSICLWSNYINVYFDLHIKH